MLREKLNAQKGLPRASYKELLEAGGVEPRPLCSKRGVWRQWSLPLLAGCRADFERL